MFTTNAIDATNDGNGTSSALAAVASAPYAEFKDMPGKQGIAELLAAQDLPSHTVNLTDIELRPTATGFEDLLAQKNPFILQPSFQHAWEIFSNHPSGQSGDEDEKHQKPDEQFIEANANDLSDLLRIINGEKVPTGIPRSTGHTIKPGRIHFSNSSGKIYAHACPTDGEPKFAIPTGARHTWLDQHKYDLSQQYINVDDVHIITVPDGSIALAIRNNKPVILMPGRHVYYDKNFKFGKNHFFSLKENNIIHIDEPILDNLSLIFINPDEIGLGTKAGVPMIMAPGLHICGNNFIFEKSYKVDSIMGLGDGDDEADEKHTDTLKHHRIQSGVLEIVRIPNSHYGFATVNGDPKVLQPGLHVINSANFAFSKMVKQTQACIDYSNLHILRIRNGEYGLAWIGQKALLIPPGEYIFDDPKFQLDKTIKQAETIVQHGDINLLRVPTGTQAFAYIDGKAHRFTEGMHAFRHASCTIDPQNVVSTTSENFVFGNMAIFNAPPGEAIVYSIGGQIEVLDSGKRIEIDELNDKPVKFLTKIDLRQRNLKLHKQAMLTAENLSVEVSAQVMYRVTDPIKFARSAPQVNFSDELDRTVDGHVREVLAGVAFSSVVSGAGEGGKVQRSLHNSSHKEEDEKADLAPGEKVQQNRKNIYAEIQDKVSTDVAAWGIEIVSVTIGEIDPGEEYRDQQAKMVQSLRDQENQVRIAAAKLETARKQQDVDIMEAESDAKAESAKLIIQANAQLQAAELRLKAAEIDAQTKAQQAEGANALLSGPSLMMARFDKLAQIVSAAASAQPPRIMMGASSGDSSSLVQSLLPLLMAQMSQLMSPSGDDVTASASTANTLNRSLISLTTPASQQQVQDHDEKPDKGKPTPQRLNQ